EAALHHVGKHPVPAFGGRLQDVAVDDVVIEREGLLVEALPWIVVGSLLGGPLFRSCRELRGSALRWRALRWRALPGGNWGGGARSTAAGRDGCRGRERGDHRHPGERASTPHPTPLLSRHRPRGGAPPALRACRPRRFKSRTAEPSIGRRRDHPARGLPPGR